MDDRLPRSAYFYLNNTIDLREGKDLEPTEARASASANDIKKTNTLTANSQ